MESDTMDRTPPQFRSPASLRKEGRVIAAHHSLLRAGGGSVALAGTGALSVVDTANALPSNFSASIWVRAHNSPTYGCAIKIGKPQPSGGQGSGAGIGYGDTRFGGGGSGPGWPGSNLVVLAESVAWTNGNVSFPITDWNHLLFIKNGLLVTVYKNGELVYSNTFTAIHSDTKTEIYVGGYEDTSSNPIRYLPCNLTRFAMWNYALSASEYDAGVSPVENRFPACYQIAAFYERLMVLDHECSAFCMDKARYQRVRDLIYVQCFFRVKPAVLQQRVRVQAASVL